MILKISSLVLIFLFGLSTEFAFAGRKCISEIKAILGPEGITPELKRIVRNQKELILDISKLITDQSELLDSPHDITLIFSYFNTSPSYNLRSNQLNTGQRLYVPKPNMTQEKVTELQRSGENVLNQAFLSMHPIHSQYIAAHEFGHGIFETSLKKIYPQLKSWDDLYNRSILPIENKLNQKTEEIKSLHRLLDQMMATKIEATGLKETPGAYLILREDLEIIELSLKIQKAESLLRKWTTAKLQIMRDNLTKNVMYFFGKTKEFGAFHELFADTIAVLAKDKYNPNAIFDALNFAPVLKDDGNQLKIYLNRSFSHPKNNLPDWEGALPWDMHGTFAPTRYFLHDTFLKRPKYQTREGKGKVLDVLFASLVENINYTIQNYDKYSMMSPHEKNDLLIRYIERNAQAKGLDFQ